MGDLFTEKEFAGYRIDSRVGRGGMGVVYRATDLSLDRKVALKMLLEELAEDPVFRQRFVSESRLAASLDHPNVIPIYAAGESDGVLYIAMRYVEGDDLRSVVRSEGRLEPARAARIVAQVGAALDAAHERGLVHRDVKPANVLLTRDDHAYLTDFGLSKRVTAQSELTSAGEVLGTLDYIAPEQIRREGLSPATDVYALGCVAFHLLTGRVPFPTETEETKLWAHIRDPPPRPGDVVEGLGTSFDNVVARAMSKRPGDRHPTAGAFGRHLLAAAGAAPRATGDSGAVARPAAPVVPAAARAGDDRREVLVDSLGEPFNLAVLGTLLAIGVALSALPLMLILAVLVYGAAVARSYAERRAGDA